MIVRASAWRAASARRAGSRVIAARSPIDSRMVPRSRIETPSRSRCWSTRWTSPTPSLLGDDLLDGGGVLLLERVEQLARLLAREQLVGVAADRLGEVGDDHRLGVDDRVAERLGLGARAVLDPDRGQAEGGLDGRDAGERRASASPGSIASRWPGMIRPRATSAPRTLMAYSCELERRRRRGCAPARSPCRARRRSGGGRRRRAASRSPPALWSTSGTRPKPIVELERVDRRARRRRRRPAAGAGRRASACAASPRRVAAALAPSARGRAGRDAADDEERDLRQARDEPHQRR